MPTDAISRSVRPRTWTCTLRSHRYEVDVTPGVKTRLVVRVDGSQVHDSTATDDVRRIGLDGDRRVEVRVGFRGAVKRVTVFDGDVDLDFDAPAGTRAARLQAWGREHPVWFALRHIMVKGGGILIALLGLGALFKALVEPVVRWIAERMPHIDWPEIPWPDIDLPDIPWPEIHLPRFPWPDMPPPPDWVLAVLDWVFDHEDIIKPLMIGLVLALAEMRRQRRQRRVRATAVDAPAADDVTALHLRLAADLRQLERERAFESRKMREVADPRLE